MALGIVLITISRVGVNESSAQAQDQTDAEVLLFAVGALLMIVVASAVAYFLARDLVSEPGKRSSRVSRLLTAVTFWSKRK